MSKINSLTFGQIITNLLLLSMFGLVIAGMLMDSSGEFGLKKNQRAQVNQICIEGEWDECIGFGERALIEITEEGDPDGKGQITLRIRKVQ